MSAKEIVVNLRTVADRVGLAPCSVSAILNRTPASRAIPKQTHDRVFRAAAELNYQPNLSARSLRTKRTHMVALFSKDFERGEVGRLVSCMERVLRKRGYLLVLGAIDRPSEWSRLSVQLRQRGVEGLIAVGMTTPRELAMPAVSVHLGDSTAEANLGGMEPANVSDLADSAINALLAKIETKVPGKTRAFSPQPHTYLAANAGVGAVEFAEQA